MQRREPFEDERVTSKTGQTNVSRSTSGDADSSMALDRRSFHSSARFSCSRIFSVYSERTYDKSACRSEHGYIRQIHCCGTVNLTALLKPLQHGFSHMGLALTPGQDGSLARDPTSGSLHDFAAQFAVQ